MFTAEITKKDFRDGVLQITVRFSDGVSNLTEAFNITSIDDMDSKIEQRLKELNTLKNIETTLVVGAWTKTVKPVEPSDEPTALQLATTKLYELKNLIGLGVMKEDDPEFVAAVTAYKTAASTK